MWSSSVFDMRSVPSFMIITWPPNFVVAALSGPVMTMLCDSRPTSARSSTERVCPPEVWAVTIDACRWASGLSIVIVLPSAETPATVTRSLWFTSRSEEATTIRSPVRHDTGSMSERVVAPALAVCDSFVQVWPESLPWISMRPPIEPRTSAPIPIVLSVGRPSRTSLMALVSGAPSVPIQKLPCTMM